MTKSVNTLVAATARMVRDLLLPAAAVLLMSGCGGGGGDSGAGASTPAVVAPSITTQPADQSVTAGQSATFSVAASGSASLSYQWQRDGVAVPGATSSTYVLSSTAMNDSGAKFAVVVSSAASSVTSNAATLVVLAAGQVVSAATGGQVKSGDGRVTLTIPPKALSADATINISPTANWSVPSALSNQFAAISGTTYAISAQGGVFDPAKLLKISFSAASLPASKSVKKLAAHPKASGSNPDPLDNLGLSQDCGDGNPVTLILAPNAYDPGTYIVGCPAGSGSSGSSSQSVTTVSLSTWTPPSQPNTPSNNNIWEDFTPRTAGTIGYQVNGTFLGAATGGNTWMGPTQVSLSSNQVGYVNDPSFTQQTSLMTLVSATGSPIAQQAMPITPADVVLDGPGNFYAMFGRFYSGATYIAYYRLEYAVDGATQFKQVWERTLTGASTSADGTHVDPLDNGVGGGNFGLDPVTGDLVALALPGYQGLTDDEKARLGFTADGFLVRFNRTGELVWATPVTPVKPYDHLRAGYYTLRIDQLGNTYVAGACMAGVSGGDCADPDSSGLSLLKIDGSGKLAWVANIASPEEIGQIRDNGVNYPASEIGIDKDADIYLTYRRFTVPYLTDGGQSGRTNVVKVAGSTGTPTPLGPVDPAFDSAGGRLWNVYGSSYVDDDGNLYIFSFANSYYVSLSALDPTLKLLGSINLLHFRPTDSETSFPGMFEVDSSGNIFEQYAGKFQNASTPGVCGNVSTGSTCYGAYLRKFHF